MPGSSSWAQRLAGCVVAVAAISSRLPDHQADRRPIALKSALAKTRGLKHLIEHAAPRGRLNFLVLARRVRPPKEPLASRTGVGRLQFARRFFKGTTMLPN